MVYDDEFDWSVLFNPFGVVVLFAFLFSGFHPELFILKPFGLWM